MKLDYSDYDFLRCRRCFRLITKPEAATANKTGRFCPCGSMSATPTDARWWEIAFLPRVWKFTYLRLRGRA